jgi:predicted methyltransferase
MTPPLFLSLKSHAPLPALLPAVLLLVALGVPGCSHDGAGDVHHDAGDHDAEKRRDSGDDAVRILARTRSAVDDPLRPDQDRKRDPDRRPAELLSFFGIDEGMRVADLLGSHGYYTEILSTVVGPEGRVYVQNNDFVVTRFDGPLMGEPLNRRLEKLRGAGRDNVERIDAEFDEMELPRDLDAALFIRFYHDLFWQPKPDGTRVDRAEFLRRVYETLKPGGVFGVVDHHAQAGSGARDALDSETGLHRIDVELVKQEVLAAGFLLQAESRLLRHPEDTRDWNVFIDNRTRRDKTDRFVLRFVKPQN